MTDLNELSSGGGLGGVLVEIDADIKGAGSVNELSQAVKDLEGGFRNIESQAVRTSDRLRQSAEKIERMMAAVEKIDRVQKMYGDLDRALKGVNGTMADSIRVFAENTRGADKLFTVLATGWRKLNSPANAEAMRSFRESFDLTRTSEGVQKALGKILTDISKTRNALNSLEDPTQRAKQGFRKIEELQKDIELMEKATQAAGRTAAAVRVMHRALGDGDIIFGKHSQASDRSDLKNMKGWLDQAKSAYAGFHSEVTGGSNAMTKSLMGVSNSIVRVFYDIETINKNGNIGQLAAVKMVGNKVVDTFNEYAKHSKKVLADAEFFNAKVMKAEFDPEFSKRSDYQKYFKGITQTGMSEAQLAEKFKHWVGGAIMVGQNSREFDDQVLNRALGRASVSGMSNKKEDTLVLAREVFSRGVSGGTFGNVSNSLGNLAQKLGVDFDEEYAHFAEYDALKTSQLFPRLVEEMAKEIQRRTKKKVKSSEVMQRFSQGEDIHDIWSNVKKTTGLGTEVATDVAKGLGLDPIPVSTLRRFSDYIKAAKGAQDATSEVVRTFRDLVGQDNLSASALTKLQDGLKSTTGTIEEHRRAHEELMKARERANKAAERMEAAKDRDPNVAKLSLDYRNLGQTLGNTANEYMKTIVQMERIMNAKAGPTYAERLASAKSQMISRAGEISDPLMRSLEESLNGAISSNMASKTNTFLDKNKDLPKTVGMIKSVLQEAAGEQKVFGAVTEATMGRVRDALVLGESAFTNYGKAARANAEFTARANKDQMKEIGEDLLKQQGTYNQLISTVEKLRRVSSGGTGGASGGGRYGGSGGGGGGLPPSPGGADGSGGGYLPPSQDDLLRRFYESRDLIRKAMRDAGDDAAVQQHSAALQTFLGQYRDAIDQFRAGWITYKSAFTEANAEVEKGFNRSLSTVDRAETQFDSMRKSLQNLQGGNKTTSAKSEFNVFPQEATAALSQMTKFTSDFNAQIKDLKIDSMAPKFNDWGKSIESLSSRIGAAKLNLAAFVTGMEGEDSKISSAVKSTKEYRDEHDKLSRTADRLRNSIIAAQKDLDGYVKAGEEAAKANHTLSNSAKNAHSSVGGLTDGLQQVIQMFAMFGVMTVFHAVKDTAIEMDRMEASLRISAGSMKAVVQEMNYLKSTAETLGVAYSELVMPFSRLEIAAKAVNYTTSETRSLFEGIVMASSALGLNLEGTRGVIKAFEQMLSKGKVMAEELRLQLGDRLPGAVNLFARAYFIARGEIDEFGKVNAAQMAKFESALRQGEVLAREVVPIVSDLLKRDMAGAAALMADKVMASFNRLSNAFTDFSRDLFNIGLEKAFIKLADIAEKLLKSGPIREFSEGFVGMMQKAFTHVDKFIDTYSRLVATLATVAGISIAAQAFDFLIARIDKTILGLVAAAAAFNGVHTSIAKAFGSNNDAENAGMGVWNRVQNIKNFDPAHNATNTEPKINNAFERDLRNLVGERADAQDRLTKAMERGSAAAPVFQKELDGVNEKINKLLTQLTYAGDYIHRDIEQMDGLINTTDALALAFGVMAASKAFAVFGTLASDIAAASGAMATLNAVMSRNALVLTVSALAAVGSAYYIATRDRSTETQKMVRQLQTSYRELMDLTGRVQSTPYSTNSYGKAAESTRKEVEVLTKNLDQLKAKRAEINRTATENFLGQDTGFNFRNDLNRRVQAGGVDIDSYVQMRLEASDLTTKVDRTDADRQRALDLAKAISEVHDKSGEAVGSFALFAAANRSLMDEFFNNAKAVRNYERDIGSLTGEMDKLTAKMKYMEEMAQLKKLVNDSYRFGAIDNVNRDVILSIINDIERLGGKATPQLLSMFKDLRIETNRVSQALGTDFTKAIGDLDEEMMKFFESFQKGNVGALKDLLPIDEVIRNAKIIKEATETAFEQRNRDFAMFQDDRIAPDNMDVMTYEKELMDQVATAQEGINVAADRYNRLLELRKYFLDQVVTRENDVARSVMNSTPVEREEDRAREESRLRRQDRQRIADENFRARTAGFQRVPEREIDRHAHEKSQINEQEDLNLQIKLDEVSIKRKTSLNDETYALQEKLNAEVRMANAVGVSTAATHEAEIKERAIADALKYGKVGSDEFANAYQRVYQLLKATDLASQIKAFKEWTLTMIDAAAASARLAEGWNQSANSARQAQVVNAGIAEIRRQGAENDPTRARAIASVMVNNDRLSRQANLSEMANQQRQLTKETQIEWEYLGYSNAEREKALAIYKTTVELQSKGVDMADAGTQAYIKQAGEIARVREVLKENQELAGDLAHVIGGSLEKALIDPLTKFPDLFKAMVQDVKQIIARQFITKPMENFISGSLTKFFTQGLGDAGNNVPKAANDNDLINRIVGGVSSQTPVPVRVVNSDVMGGIFGSNGMPMQVDIANISNVGQWSQLIGQSSSKYGVDPSLIAAIMHVESRGNPNAVNPSSGASGLMQVMPKNWSPYGISSNPFDPSGNIDAGTRIFKEHLVMAGGDINKALSSYSGHVNTDGSAYVAAVLAQRDKIAGSGAVYDQATQSTVQLTDAQNDSINSTMKWLSTQDKRIETENDGSTAIEDSITKTSSAANDASTVMSRSAYGFAQSAASAGNSLAGGFAQVVQNMAAAASASSGSSGSSSADNSGASSSNPMASVRQYSSIMQSGYNLYNGAMNGGSAASQMATNFATSGLGSSLGLSTSAVGGQAAIAAGSSNAAGVAMMPGGLTASTNVMTSAGSSLASGASMVGAAAPYGFFGGMVGSMIGNATNSKVAAGLSGAAVGAGSAYIGSILATGTAMGPWGLVIAAVIAAVMAMVGTQKKSTGYSGASIETDANGRELSRGSGGKKGIDLNPVIQASESVSSGIHTIVAGGGLKLGGNLWVGMENASNTGPQLKLGGWEGPVVSHSEDAGLMMRDTLRYLINNTPTDYDPNAAPDGTTKTHVVKKMVQDNVWVPDQEYGGSAEGGDQGTVVSGHYELQSVIKDVVEAIDPKNAGSAAGVPYLTGDPLVIKAIMNSKAGTGEQFGKDIDAAVQYSRINKITADGFDPMSEPIQKMYDDAKKMGEQWNTTFIDMKDRVVSLGLATSDEAIPKLRKVFLAQIGLDTGDDKFKPLAGIDAVMKQAEISVETFKPVLASLGYTFDQQAAIISQYKDKVKENYLDMVNEYRRQGKSYLNKAIDPNYRTTGNDMLRDLGLTPSNFDDFKKYQDVIDKYVNNPTAEAARGLEEMFGTSLKDGVITADQYNNAIRSVTEAFNDGRDAVTGLTKDMLESYKTQMHILEERIQKTDEAIQKEEELHNTFQDLVTSLGKLRASNQYGDMSPLSGFNKLQTVMSELSTAFINSQSTDPTIAQQGYSDLQSLSTEALQSARDYYGSSEGYLKIFNKVQDDILKKAQDNASTEVTRHQGLMSELQTQRGIMQQQLERLTALTEKVVKASDIKTGLTSVIGNSAFSSGVDNLGRSMADVQNVGGVDHLFTRGEYQATARMLGYEGDFGNADHGAWLTAKPERQAELAKAMQYADVLKIAQNKSTVLGTHVDPQILGLNYVDAQIGDTGLTVGQQRAIGWAMGYRGEYGSGKFNPWIDADAQRKADYTDLLKYAATAATGRAFRNGGMVPGYAGGGMISNGLPDVDSVMARLGNGALAALAGGEFISPAPVAQRYLPQLEAMRNGTYQDGNGEVTELRKEVCELKEMLAQQLEVTNQLLRLIGETNVEGHVATVKAIKDNEDSARAA